VAVARAYAADRGLAVEFVRFSWPDLLVSLSEKRFDVAMSGITIRPERSAVGVFTVPVAETGAVVLVRQPERWQGMGDLNRPPVRLAVNAGGHLERVARAHFPLATLVVIKDNAAVRAALVETIVDGVVTDDLEARAWLRGATGWQRMGPFTRDRKAYLARADRADLAADLDRWLLESERSGALAALRAEHGVANGAGAGAGPLTALLAAIDERLALMPTVGAAKRETGFPLEVPEREGFVLDAAVAAVTAEASGREVPVPSREFVRALYRAQIEAAKEVQWSAVSDPAFVPPDPLPDVEAVLRPALLRIGDRIARLLIDLPPGLERDTVRGAARDALRTPRLSAARRRAIADAIADLSRAGADALAIRSGSAPGPAPRR
jgi:cyclohexadienyl dehydratase